MLGVADLVPGFIRSQGLSTDVEFVLNYADLSDDERLAAEECQLADGGQPENTIPYVLNDENTTDSYGTRFAADGWKLGRYRKNPVVQADHNYQAEYTIARGIRTWVEGGRILQANQFHRKTDLSNSLYELIKDKFLRGISPGFYVRKWERIKVAGKSLRRGLEMELLESSIVSIPANQNALSKVRSAHGVHARNLARHYEQLLDEHQYLGFSEDHVHSCLRELSGNQSTTSGPNPLELSARAEQLIADFEAIKLMATEGQETIRAQASDLVESLRGFEAQQEPAPSPAVDPLMGLLGLSGE